MFVVIVEEKTSKGVIHNVRAAGPYRSFKRADADAKAFEHGSRSAYVLSVQKPEEVA